MVIDGAMGTLLHPHLPRGGCADHANITAPDIVANIHCRYAAAGADIILTNTFGANRPRLTGFGLQNKVKQINQAGARLARKAADKRAWVAGSMGPGGKLVEPLGKLSFAETYEAYKEQALILAEAGVDLFILETFADLKEAKIALMAVRRHTDLPIMIAMTFREDFLTFTGTDPGTACNVLSGLGADAVGVNCSTGPEPMIEIIGRMALVTEKPIFVKPNAVIYDRAGDGVVTEVSAQQMARFAESFVEIGANIMGTCCGSNPSHTEQLKAQLKGKKPVSRSIPPLLRLSSRYRTVEIGTGLPFCIIGERINPTNRQNLSTEIQASKINLIRQEARSQETQGAHVLDVNIGVPGIDEPALMEKVVRGIETAVRLPLSIDSTDPKAVEAALCETAGKPLINSVTGESKSLQDILPLAARYGTGLICLAVDDEGIPRQAANCLKVLKKIVSKAEKAGIARQNLILDCAALTVSVQQKRAQETLRAIDMVKQELGLPTVLGIANISFGLPDRALINSSFLGMAMAVGLDAAIMNPGERRMLETVKAASVLTLRDKDSSVYVKAQVKKKKQKGDDRPTILINDRGKIIYQSILSGSRQEIGPLIEKAIASGFTAPELNDQILIPAIERVGQKYERKEIYLAQMILSAETFQAGFKVLEPYFNTAGINSKGPILMCTVKGDVHDIGKNIVVLFLKNHGFNVIDLGKNVAAGEILKRALEYKADIVGLSALMTTSMIEMPGVVELFNKEGVPTKIIIGGAAVTRKFAEDIGAHAYAPDGVSAVEQVKQLMTSAKPKNTRAYPSIIDYRGLPIKFTGKREH